MKAYEASTIWANGTEKYFIEGPSSGCGFYGYGIPVEPYRFKKQEDAEAMAGILNEAFEAGQKSKSHQIKQALGI